MLVCNDVGAVREAYLRFSHLRARSPQARAASERAFDLGLNLFSYPSCFVWKSLHLSPFHPHCGSGIQA